MIQKKDLLCKEIESLMFDDIIKDGIPSDLDVLSTHTMIDEASAIKIDTQRIDESSAFISGSGKIAVTLHYGSIRENDDLDRCKSFPFHFELVIDMDSKKIVRSKYDFDTDSYYESMI
jgi:hypothetical protein